MRVTKSPVSTRLKAAKNLPTTKSKKYETDKLTDKSRKDDNI